MWQKSARFIKFISNLILLQLDEEKWSKRGVSISVIFRIFVQSNVKIKLYTNLINQLPKRTCISIFYLYPYII